MARKLPCSTTVAALARTTLPPEELVIALVSGCGGDRQEVRRWLSSLRRIAAQAELPNTTPAGVPKPATRPRCTLPADKAVFVGRDEELDQIATAVAHAAQAGGGIAIHVIDDMPGIGKTRNSLGL
jgi:hypothetical protein